MASTTWLQYYEDRASVDDGNPVNMMAKASLGLLNNVTRSNLDKPDRFRSTVAAHNPAAIIIVPQDDGMVQLLHHTSLFAKGLGSDPETAAVSGNRMSAPIKLIDVDDAVTAIGATGSAHGTRPKAISTPDLKAMFGVKSSAEFVALKPVDKNTPLKDCPNHLMGKLHLLDLADYCQKIRANEIAWLLIQTILVFPDSNDEERAELKRMQDELELTLAFLWHVSNGLSLSVELRDVGDADEALDRFCQKIRDKLCPNRASGQTNNQNSNDTGGTGGGRVNVTLDTTVLNATQQALLTSVNAMTTSLLAVDAEKKDKKSILNGMSPMKSSLVSVRTTSGTRTPSCPSSSSPYWQKRTRATSPTTYEQSPGTGKEHSSKAHSVVS